MSATPVTSDVPVLILSGGLDPVTPPSYGAEVASTLPNSRHVVAAGYGHIVSPHACAPRLIAAFIDDPDFAELPPTCVAALREERAAAAVAGSSGRRAVIVVDDAGQVVRPARRSEGRRRRVVRRRRRRDHRPARTERRRQDDAAADARDAGRARCRDGNRSTASTSPATATRCAGASACCPMPAGSICG